MSKAVAPPATASEQSNFTPKELAGRWKCSPDHVLDLLRGKQLHGFTLSKPGSKRPRWRISFDAVAEFEAKDHKGPTVTPKRRGPTKSTKVISFY